ncbi:MAG: hypothetical protein DI536_04255 [Archangium gephyra]|uniref:Uncharacterized protein n=1 Tax=Archangium gephyra TaxID=48 RepID=A0A2W5TSF0_9BACT|nr:MAG: hypothetical protein DI536_04255 [Archangium gephyra]
MRVPTIDGPDVLPDNRYRVTAPMQRQPDFNPARALGDVSQVVGQSARVVDAAADQQLQVRQAAELKAQKQARALVESEAMLAFGKGADARLANFKKLRGTQASAAEADVVDDLDAWRQETAQSIADADARMRFLERSADPLVAYRKQIGQHTFDEFEAARGDAVKAAKDSLLSKAESGQLTRDELEVLARDAEKTIRDNQTSEAAGNAELADFRSATQSRYVEGLLARGDVAAAQELIDNPEVQKRLGSRAAETTTKVKKAAEGRKKDLRDAEIAGLVDRAAQRVKNSDDYVAENDLRAELSPNGNALPEDVEEAVQKRVRIDAAKLKNDITEYNKALKRAENDGLPVPGGVRDWLQKYDPDALLAYRQRQRALADRARNLRDGTAASRAAENKFQNDVDEAYRNRLRARLAQDPSADPADVEKEFTVEYSKRYGRPVTISDPERERGGATSVEAKNRDEKLDNATEKAAGKRIETAVTRAARAKLKKGQKLDEAALNEEVGRLMGLYDQQMLERGGKPLTEKEWAGFEAVITTDMIEKRPGRFWGTNDVNVGRIGQQPSLPAAGASSTTAPEEKTIGGKRFRRVNGKWVQQ